MAATNIQSFSGDVEVTSNLTVDTNTLHVDSIAGRVGIGKTDPAYAVDVNGTLNATSLYVGGSELPPWSSNISNVYYTTGAIGIGTDFPKKDLEVQGTLRLSNVVTGSAASDFYVRADPSGTTWDSGTRIDASDGQSNESFGQSASISSDGSVAFVGASYARTPSVNSCGAAYIFTRTGDTWDSGIKIFASDAAQGDAFGYSVSISSDGSWAMSSAIYDDAYKGAGYIFKKTGASTWDSGTKIVEPIRGASHFFGITNAISSDGSWAVSGSQGYNNYQGAGYIFKRTHATNNTWDGGTRILASSPVASSRFGRNITISRDGSWVLVGAYYGPAAPRTGNAYIFKRTHATNNTWDAGVTITPAGLNDQDRFGKGLAISSNGSWAVVGGYLIDESPTKTNTGAVYVFKRTHATNNTWDSGTKIVTSDAATGDNFGRAISISDDGTVFVAGAKGVDSPTVANGGAAYIFTRTGDTWDSGTKIAPTDSASNDQFGDKTTSISISGDGLWIIGGVKDNDGPLYNEGGRGTAYIFKGTESSENPASLIVSTQIEAEGTLLSFTGQHICFPEGSMTQGMVVSANKNKYVSLNGPLTTGTKAIKSSESIPVVSLSNVSNDRSVFGIIDSIEYGGTSRKQTSGGAVVRSDKELGDNRVIVNSLGEGAMWVANTNGVLKSGDYITTSNIAGYGQKQDDDILHSYTAAKITMDCDFEPEDIPVQIIKKGEDGQNVLDRYGRIQWEEVPGRTERAYQVRYLTTDGRWTDQANAVWKAAYVGCTYHCG